jgi:hypothetical protein
MMTRRASVAVAVWLWCLGVVVIGAADRDRLDDQLMLAVAKMQLKDDPDIRCVRGLRHDRSFGPVSDWFLFRERVPLPSDTSHDRTQRVTELTRTAQILGALAI